MKNERISQIACGNFHTVLLKNNEEVYVFGRNYNGQLGLGHNNDQNVPQLLMKDENINQIACGSYHTVILKSNGNVYIFGNNKVGERMDRTGLKPARSDVVSTPSPVTGPSQPAHGYAQAHILRDKVNWD
jgi:alpha-tubulin suppressor-like RCC1 family protein